MIVEPQRGSLLGLGAVNLRWEMATMGSPGAAAMAQAELAAVEEGV